MSELSDAAHVTLIVGDYAAFDSNGRLNLIGGGWQVTGGPVLPQNAVAVLIRLPQSFAGDQIPVTLTLRNASEEPVELPQPDGTKSALRLAQMPVLEKPQVPGVALPKELPSQVLIATVLPPGIPLAPGEMYHWTVHIDDVTKPEWRADFYFAPGQTPPVFG